MSAPTVVILDPGHGMGNRKSGVFDSGAVSENVREADIAMAWANELRAILRARGTTVVRTRIDNKDPCSISARARIARQYNGTIMLSLHCNSSPGASGTETFYRGDDHRDKAKAINDAVVKVLETKDRGVKTEGQSQHTSLAVMSFQPCFLLEIGFIDSTSDRTKMLDAALRKKTCEAIADILTA